MKPLVPEEPKYLKIIARAAKTRKSNAKRADYSKSINLPEERKLNSQLTVI
jgi:hypothetical protein